MSQSPILGFKEFRVYGLKVPLVSLASIVFWNSPFMVARHVDASDSFLDKSEDHESPDKDCSCGIAAYNHWKGHWGTTYEPWRAAVRAWPGPQGGRLTIFHQSDRWRASHAEIIALKAPRLPAITRRAIEGGGMSVEEYYHLKAEYYGVPLFHEAKALVAYAEEFGVYSDEGRKSLEENR